MASRKQIALFIAVPVLALALVAGVAGFVLYLSLSKGLPSIEWARRYRPPIVSTVWSGDEQLVGEFYNERRVVVPYEKIPKKLKQALIASEDATFFEHSGVSYAGIARAVWSNLRHKHVIGGSTLSQQTAKAILASSEGVKAAHERRGWPGIRRKLREFLLTRRLEANFDKEHIL